MLIDINCSKAMLDSSMVRRQPTTIPWATTTILSSTRQCLGMVHHPSNHICLDMDMVAMGEWRVECFHIRWCRTVKCCVCDIMLYNLGISVAPLSKYKTGLSLLQSETEFLNNYQCNVAPWSIYFL